MLWRAPGPWLVRDNGAGEDILHGAVAPQDDKSNKTFFFKFTVDPLSDSLTDKAWETRYQAGLVFYDHGVERLGVGNGMVAHAYSAFNATGRGLLDESTDKTAADSGELDLFAAYKGSGGYALTWPHRGEPHTILIRVQYVPHGDALVTIWFEPDLTPGNSESSQLPGQVTQLRANAAFDQLRLIHRGGGDGWRFSNLAVATSFNDFVTPHLWQRWWVITPSALAVLAFIVGSVMLLERRRTRLQLQRLEGERAIEQERVRIAQDLHDELGARLTEISMLAGQSNRDGEDRLRMHDTLRRIGEIAHETAEMTEGIVWAVNPRSDTLHHLANYLVRFAEDFFRPTPIRCRLDVPVQVPDIRLSSQVRHHLLLAVKEACNNVARHSGATEVWLRLEPAATSLTIRVEDNGCGFDLTKTQPGGNGLANLRARMTGIGGSAGIVSAIDKGTGVTLVVPLPNH